MLIENKYITEKQPSFHYKLDNIIKKRRESQKIIADSYIDATVNTVLKMILDALKKDIITKPKFYFSIDANSRFNLQLAERVVKFLNEKLQSIGIRVQKEQSIFSEKSLSYTIILNTITEEY